MDDPAPYVECRGVRFPREDGLPDGETLRALRRGTYERKEADAAHRLLRRPDRVLEIGAGIGFMSTFAAKVCRVEAAHCYEANPALIPYIRRVHEANGVEGRATAHNALLAPDGEAAGGARFYIREAFVASSMDPGPPGIVREETVPLKGMSEAFAEAEPTALICDIEGAEADLVPRMPLEGLRLAILELHPQWIGKDGVAAVFDAMHRAGLVFFPKASNGKVAAFKRRW
ncbi:FkbM family methyltransferase [Hasllibacter halocynthiae]|uniref:FkbM family methyltransferase n=1 Tax=Hasllibacter halocynthiae TaxID=595589 RepID=A0A2T0X8N7_9RHOB|nr:FkbM family methyltransferase [Hasllibacter halocynthiae]PRY95308.1 FkbM family methyltransferase [Hasllibacter halocynthiae]